MPTSPQPGASRRAPRYGCAVLAAALLLAGCASLAPTAARDNQGEPARDLQVAKVLAVQGLKKLDEHRYEDASRIFNAALKFSPDTAQLHFLNGLTYQLLYLRGDESMRELALTGFQLALEADPALYHAALQLGRLEFGARHYARAAAAFSHAATLDPQQGEAWLGLAGAAYYDHDLQTAQRAIEIATPLLGTRADAARAAAMIHAALGHAEQAGAALARHAQSAPADAQAQLARRVDQWHLWHVNFDPAAQAGQRPGALQDSPPRASNGAPPVLNAALLLAQAAVPTGGAPAGTATPVPDGVREPALPNWSDCTAPGGIAVPATSAAAAPASGNGDETTAIPPLPPPCKGAGFPNMALLDVVIVRTENNASSSHGINLLDGLTYVFNASKTIADVVTQGAGAESRNVTITRQRSNSFPGSAGFAYSLNIANATDARSEVLARPSLVALDRQASTFFSGRNLTLGVSGSNGTAGMIADKAFGVSLSVTPTFIDANSMLLAVRAGRSFLEQVDLSVQFPHSMQTTRNVVAANVALKFGQTLILSGLTEREVQRNVGGVPVLQDIPLLQYLFSNAAVQNFTRSELIMITPRRVGDEEAQMARALPELARWNGGRMQDRIPKIVGQMTPEHAETNFDAVYKHLLHNELYLQFRSGDVRSDDWSHPGRLQSMFEELGGMLYF